MAYPPLPVQRKMNQIDENYSEREKPPFFYLSIRSSILLQSNFEMHNTHTHQQQY